MKIYTKKGDQGTTALIDNKRVSKDSIRVNTYGTVDELNAHIALLSTLISDKICKEHLNSIQLDLFTIQTNLAVENKADCSFPIKALEEKQVNWLEENIDKMQSQLPVNKFFVMLNGNTTIAQCHIARTVCRRAERLLVTLQREKTVEQSICSYINRLSDFLFVLARYVALLDKVEEQEVPLK